MHHIKTLLFQLLFLTILFSSCSPSEAQEKTLIAEEIDAIAAYKMIGKKSGNENLIILDTRSVREYEGDHIKNSVFINILAPDVKDQILKLDNNKTYLLYCHSGGRSAMIQKFMEKNGFVETYNLKGGIVSWRSKGFETVKD